MKLHHTSTLDVKYNQKTNQKLIAICHFLLSLMQMENKREDANHYSSHTYDNIGWQNICSFIKRYLINGEN